MLHKFSLMNPPTLSRDTIPHRPWADRLPPPIVMMGVPLDQLDTAQALEIVSEMIASRTPHLLATANVDFLAQVQSDETLRRILVDADLIVCDGTPLDLDVEDGLAIHCPSGSPAAIWCRCC